MHTLESIAAAHSRRLPAAAVAAAAAVDSPAPRDVAAMTASAAAVEAAARVACGADGEYPLQVPPCARYARDMGQIWARFTRDLRQIARNMRDGVLKKLSRAVRACALSGARPARAPPEALSASLRALGVPGGGETASSVGCAQSVCARCRQRRHDARYSALPTAVFTSAAVSVFTRRVCTACAWAVSKPCRGCVRVSAGAGPLTGRAGAGAAQ
jgi:hypothetical protein